MNRFRPGRRIKSIYKAYLRLYGCDIGRCHDRIDKKPDLIIAGHCRMPGSCIDHIALTVQIIIISHIIRRFIINLFFTKNNTCSKFYQKTSEYTSKKTVLQSCIELQNSFYQFKRISASRIRLNSIYLFIIFFNLVINN